MSDMNLIHLLAYVLLYSTAKQLRTDMNKPHTQIYKNRLTTFENNSRAGSSSLGPIYSVGHIIITLTLKGK
jgi:hypothetical protein